jgi:hypothetical protein
MDTSVPDPQGVSDSCSAAVEITRCVPVDIKPRSCPNPMNVTERAVLPAAILGTEDFDVTGVKPDES